MAPHCTSEPPSLSELASEYQTWTSHFASSPLATSLARIITYEMPPSIHLTRCICLGLGNFAPRPISPSAPSAPSSTEEAAHSQKRRYRSLHQLVFLGFVLTVLDRNSNHSKNNDTDKCDSSGISKKEVYLQDPSFTPLETAFLQTHLHYTVLSDPAAYGKMTPTTFLFAPCVPNWVRARALEVAVPGLYVSVDVERDLETLGVGYRCPYGGVPMQRTFRRLRDRTVGRRLPEGEGEEGEGWLGVCGVRWVRGKTML